MANCETNCWTAKSSTPSWKRRCSSLAGGRPTTPSARTARWGTDPRPRSRAAPVRLLRLRLCKQTEATPWQAYPGDRQWFHSWGQVTNRFRLAATNPTTPAPMPSSPSVEGSGTAAMLPAGVL
jgi:hypothetical protein